MKILLSKSFEEIQKNGFWSFGNKAARYVYFNFYKDNRNNLPSNLSNKQKLNGVLVESEEAKLLDNIIGFPYHEDTEIDYIKKYVNAGDKVVDIGGGVGVSSVWAARKAGKSGKITVYEPSSTCIERMRRTFELNKVEAEIQINHALVSEEAGKIRFEEGENAEKILPQDIPDCDVLNMDCEGAELAILKEMNITPKMILVETHSMYGSSGTDVIEVLKGLDYEVLEVNGDLKDISQIAARHEES